MEYENNFKALLKVAKTNDNQISTILIESLGIDITSSSFQAFIKENNLSVTYSVEDTGVEKLIKKAELNELIRIAQIGEDVEKLTARDKIRSLLDGFCRRIVGKYSNPNNFDDLYNLSLMSVEKSIDNFDIESNVIFSSYLAMVIRNDITKYYYKDRMIGMSEHTAKNLKKVISYAVENDIIAWTDEEISIASKVLGFSITQIKTYIKIIPYDSVDFIIDQSPDSNGDTENDLTSLEFKAADTNVEEEVLNKELTDCLHDAVDMIEDEKIRFAVKEYYGLNDTNEPMFYCDIAKALGVTEYRVKQFIKSGLDMLKDTLAQSGYTSFAACF